MKRFCAFASLDAQELGYNDVTLEAETQENARLKFAELCDRVWGWYPVSSDTSEEVWFTDETGNEIVYYGFVEVEE